MIKELRIINFKSHKNTILALGNLTILAGQNGVGKSSIIQSLLLLRQTNQKNRLDKILELNEPLCYLGKSNDVLYQFENEEFENEIHFVLSNHIHDFSFCFDAQGNSDYLTRIGDNSDSSGYESLNLFGNNFQYISAHRNTDYESKDYDVKELKQISYKEGKGELVAQFLYEYGRKHTILPQLKHPNEDDLTLLNQVNAWEREISSNVNVKTELIGNNYDIKYTFNTDSKFGETDEFSKQNVGFGLSYALPIIVAILSAEKKSLIIIENPEAHIHPYGVSKLIELISIAAEAGIQIIVETHSDHIINGVLVQCKNFEGIEQRGINSENVKIYHFNRNETEHSTDAKEIGIKKGGKLINRPLGFFDQMGKDLRKLI